MRRSTTRALVATTGALALALTTVPAVAGPGPDRGGQGQGHGHGHGKGNPSQPGGPGTPGRPGKPGWPGKPGGPHGGAVDLGRETLPDGDGWASWHGTTAPDGVPREATGTNGGAEADASQVYVVDTWTELRDALAGRPGGSQDDARYNEVPRIVYVTGTVDAWESADGARLTCEDFAGQVTVEGTGKPFSMDDYIEAFDPAGPWGPNPPSGPLEEARQAAADVQAAQVQQHVGSNVTLVGVGDDARIVGANLRIRDAHDVIVRNIRFSDAYDCFPEWDPDDTGAGNWNSAYDNVSVWTSTSVWVDHSTFDDGEHPPASLPTVYGRPFEVHDGLLDITHGSDLVTVSHNRFVDHDKTNLVGSSDSRTQDRGQHRVTYHDNHWVDVGQRAPRVRYGDVHVYNDLYEQTEEGLFQYWWGAGRESSIYAEANAFRLADGVDPARIIANWGGTELYETDSLVNGRVVDLVAAFNATAEEPLEPTARWNPADHYDYDPMPVRKVERVVPRTAGAGVLDSGSPVADGAPHKVLLSAHQHRWSDEVRATVRVVGRDRATVVRLVADGEVVAAEWVRAGRGTQEVHLSVDLEPGRHTLRAEALNPHGVTESREVVVRVR